MSNPPPSGYDLSCPASAALAPSTMNSSPGAQNLYEEYSSVPADDHASVGQRGDLVSSAVNSFSPRAESSASSADMSPVTMQIGQSIPPISEAPAGHQGQSVGRVSSSSPQMPAVAPPTQAPQSQISAPQAASQPRPGLGWEAMRCGPGPSDSQTRERSLAIVRALADERDDSFYDVTFRVQSRLFRAHRALLAIQSRVFRVMFTSGMREQHERVIDLEDVDADAFAFVLRFVYGGILHDVPREMLVDVFHFAHQMDMPELEAASTNVLLRGLLSPVGDLRTLWFKTCNSPSPYHGQCSSNPRSSGRSAPSTSASLSATRHEHPVPVQPNVLISQSQAGIPRARVPSTDRAANERGLGGFPRRAPVTFLAKEIEDVLDSPEFLHFPFVLLERVLRSDTLAVPEILLFERAMAWADAKQARGSDLEDVLDCIRFGLMPQEDINLARKSSIAQLSPRFESRLLDAVEKTGPRSRSRILGLPHIMFACEETKATLNFVVEGMVYVVSAARIVSGNRPGIKLSIATSDESRSSYTYALAYARSKSGRGVISGRIVPAYFPKRSRDCEPTSVSDEIHYARMVTIMQREVSREGGCTTLWDVPPGEIVFVAVHLFLRPGSNPRDGDSSVIRSIPSSSPFIWDAEDAAIIGPPVPYTMSDWWSAPVPASVGLSAFNWNALL